LISLTPNDPVNHDDHSEEEAEFQEVLKLKEEEKYNDAYNRLLAFVQRRKKITGVQGYLSFLAYLADKKEDAIEHMRVAIEAFPKSRQASLLFINILAGCGRDSDIQTEIARYISEQGAIDSPAHRKLQVLLERLRASSKQDQIAAAVRQVLEFDDDWWVNEL